MIKTLKSSVGGLYLKYKDFERARFSNGIAKNMLAEVEAIKGKTDPRLIKQSDEYAQEVLGSKIYAPWLYTYAAIAGTFKEGWIPDLYYGQVVVPELKGQYGHVSHLNSLNLSLFRSNSFPDIGSYVNGMFFAKDLSPVREQDLSRVLFKDYDKVVFKVDDSRKGRGVHLFDRDSFDPKKIQALGNGVFQEYIRQHEWFDQIMPNSVGTLRVTTVFEDEGEVSVRAAHLRVGRAEDTHVKSSTQLRVPVDHHSCKLMSAGYTSKYEVMDRHPDTGFVFADQEVPGFRDCMEKAIELQRAMPFARCIGWDMTLDRSGRVKTMEWNGAHNGIKFSEPTVGPCFADLGWEDLWRSQK